MMVVVVQLVKAEDESGSPHLCFKCHRHLVCCFAHSAPKLPYLLSTVTFTQPLSTWSVQYVPSLPSLSLAHLSRATLTTVVADLPDLITISSSSTRVFARKP